MDPSFLLSTRTSKNEEALLYCAVTEHWQKLPREELNSVQNDFEFLLHFINFGKYPSSVFSLCSAFPGHIA